MTRTVLRLLAAVAVIHLVLILPATPLPWTEVARRLPAELTVALALLCVGGRVARIALTVILSLLAIQKIADLMMSSALGRPFNVVADIPLIDALLRLIAGSFGMVAACAAGVAAVLAAIAIVLGLWWATGVWSRIYRPGRIAAALALVAIAALPLIGTTWAQNSLYAKARFDLALETVAQLRQFRQAVAQDAFAERRDLLTAIDRDVIVIFIESYGRASFDAPEYAAMHLETLRDAQTTLATAGLSMRSGFLRAPTQGGQSWLSHATFANGLWTPDQTRYAALLASGRASLFHLAQRAGFTTVAVMPAITLPWPEAATMGFDRVLAAADLGYRGEPFNWVTMPDQFTLTALDRMLHERTDSSRFFVQVALISSHAPWTPVPWLLPWDQIGDGTEFDAMAMAGDSPEVVWRDQARVRDAYRDAIDYSLRAVMEYAARHADNPPLLIVLGDHQAAPGIAQSDGQDVPIHLIGTNALIQRSAGWGFATGLIPDANAPAIPMDQMRDMILHAFDAAETPA